MLGGGEARGGTTESFFSAAFKLACAVVVAVVSVFLQRKFPLPEAIEVRFKLFSAPAHPRTALLARFVAPQSLSLPASQALLLRSRGDALRV